LSKDEIRLHYSGFIIFAAKLLTVATGMGFTLLITRTVSQEEYGYWGTLNIILPYFTLLSTAFPFWVMRFVARDKEGATRTGILANTTIGAIATLVYIALFPLVVPAYGLGNYLTFYFVASINIIEAYLIAILEACLQARRPQFVGYGLLIGEVIKILLAYVFIVILRLSLLGVVSSIAIAFAVKVTFYIKTVWKELQGRIVFGYITEWMKGSTLNIMNIVGDRVAAIIFLILPIYGTEIAASYYWAAAPIANIIAYSSFLAFALYPKILAENKLEEATMSLRLVLMFSIPMTVALITIPTSYLLILKENVYIDATPVLMILAIDAFILTISSTFGSVLFGIEKVDEKAKIPLKQAIKSRLSIALALPWLHSMITLPIAFYILPRLGKDQPLLVATYAVGINTAAKFAMFIVQYIIVRTAVKIEIPWKNIARYVCASAVMAVVLYVFQPTRLSSTLIVTAIGGIVYLAFLMAIDQDARMLVKTIFRELRKRGVLPN